MYNHAIIIMAVFVAVAAASAHPSGSQLQMSYNGDIPSVRDTVKKLSPVTNPADSESNLELIRRKRVERLSSKSEDNAPTHAQSISSSSNTSALPSQSDFPTKKYSTTKASDISKAKVSFLSDQSHSKFACGNSVKVNWGGKPRYGIIKYLGEVSGIVNNVVGIEMVSSIRMSLNL